MVWWADRLPREGILPAAAALGPFLGTGRTGFVARGGPGPVREASLPFRVFLFGGQNFRCNLFTTFPKCSGTWTLEMFAHLQVTQRQLLLSASEKQA